MEPKTQLVTVALPNGQSMQIEASVIDRLESAGFESKNFDGVIGAIEGIALAVQTALAKVKPAKASVELGLEVGVESGQLTALLVKGSGKANLKITLTWE
jgi:Trypsin-co-occurring domain 1